MRLLLLLSVSLMVQWSYAQRPFEGRIHYSVDYLSFPDGMEGAELALPQQMTLLVEGENYRMQQASALAGELVWIKPSGVDTIYQLFEFMDQKVFLAVSQDEQAKHYRIVERDGEQTIAGWDCEKRYLQAAEGLSSEAWVVKRYANPLTVDFPGLQHLPLEFELVRNGIHMRLSAMRVSEESLDKTYFMLPGNAVRITDDVLRKIMN